MSPKYKLTYFNFKALGEPIRFLLSYGGIDFEEVRMDFYEWDKNKESAPFGLLPLLEVDGKVVNQSKAIARFLAKKVKLTGKDDWEDLQIDSVVETIYDFRKECAAYFIESDEVLKAKKREVLLKETVPFYMNKLDNLAKENGGYFVGGKLTWADVYFAGMHETYSHFTHQNLLDNRPHLKSVVDKVYALPAIKAWIAKRPPNELF